MARAVVDGVDCYYEDRGAGAPVVLMHGGLEDGGDWSVLADALVATGRRVIVPDRRGHGRTPDVDGRYTYEAMAAETIELIEQVVGAPVHLVGYSDGGIIAWIIGVRRPDLVRTLVPISANIDAAAMSPIFRERLEHADPFGPNIAPMRERHGEVSPDGPGHWATFHAKVTEMGLARTTLTLDEIAGVSRPVLVIAADDDFVTLESTIALAQAVPDGQLAILPGTTHLLLHEKPELLVGLVESFLADPVAQRMMPVRTAQPAAASS